MKKTAYILIVLAGALAGSFYLGQEAPSIPKKIACSADPDCAIRITDCTCGGPIYSCVSSDYPQLECRNESFTCQNKQNPAPEHCGCESNACTARSCAGICGEWKQQGYSDVLKNVERLKEANCCYGAEDCMDICAGGPAFREEDLDCIAVASPQEYARQRCKGYVSNASIGESNTPLTPKREAKTFSVSCFYAGERVLGGYAFSYKGKFCDLDQAGMGFLFSPVGAEEALDYYLFSARNISEKKDEKQYELISDFGAFISNRADCNITAHPPTERTTIGMIPGGFNVSVLEYLPSKKQAVYEQASVYKNGNIERIRTAVISAC